MLKLVLIACFVVKLAKRSRTMPGTGSFGQEQSEAHENPVSGKYFGRGTIVGPGKNDIFGEGLRTHRTENIFVYIRKSFI